VAARPAQPGRFEVRWDGPAVKEGVIIRADLAISPAVATGIAAAWTSRVIPPAIPIPPTFSLNTGLPAGSNTSADP
jgi:hypothetical protein